MAAGNTLRVFRAQDRQPGTLSTAQFAKRNGHPVLLFDKTTDESAAFASTLPTHYSGRGLNVFIVWSATAVTTGDVVWTAAIEAHHDDSVDLDSDHFATALSATGTTASASGNLKYTRIDLAPGAEMDSLLAGESLRLLVTRDANNVADTLDNDAEVHRVEIRESLVLVLAGGGGEEESTTRDPLQWPFAATSIWNMPIGSNADYQPAGPDGVGDLPAVPGSPPNVWASLPFADNEKIVLKPTAPLANLMFSGAGWSGANRCAATGGLLAQVPIPDAYVVPHSNTNNSATFLLADGRTLLEAQPLARCTAAGIATAVVAVAPHDLYGAGANGTHGGSGLSAFGGTLRLGELRPGSQGPRHALKLEMYSRQLLYKATTFAEAFRWPATRADSYAVGWYGTIGDNTNTAMKMGALLAIPTSTDITALGLETEPAMQIAWTLQNYGAYLVDDAFCECLNVCVEDGADGSFPDQFLSDYGFAFNARPVHDTAWTRDWQRLIPELMVVDNNASDNIGGGGTPLQPLAPPFE